MKTYLAKWPDGTLTLVSADDLLHLYDLLDAEGDPGATEFAVLRQVHFSIRSFEKKDRLDDEGEDTTIVKNEVDDNGAGLRIVRQGESDCKNLKWEKFPADMFARWVNAFAVQKE